MIKQVQVQRVWNYNGVNGGIDGEGVDDGDEMETDIMAQILAMTQTDAHLMIPPLDPYGFPVSLNYLPIARGKNI